MRLIADSGSTKTSWRLGNEAIETIGLNPVRDSAAQITHVVDSLPQGNVSEVYFYGAGCIAPFKEHIAEALTAHYPKAEVHVESDMLGAARACCKHEAGIVGILGTGSNSCLFDGEMIADNVSPLGYILGDEGSGAVLGRTLVGDALKGQLGAALRDALLEEMELTPTLIIERVYRQPMPNRFLASLVPFIHRHRSHPALQEMLHREFRRFFVRNIRHYERPDLPVHLVGGIAASFITEIAYAAQIEGFKLGHILPTPIDALVDYHQ